MVNAKGKKITVKTEKKPGLLTQGTTLPPLENPFETLDEVNRMYYGDPWMKPWWGNWILNQALGTSPQSRMKMIPVDLVDTGKTYQIVTEMPGVIKKDIEVLVTSKTISICGKTETNIRKEAEGYLKRERGYSTLCRYLRFPEDVDPDNAEAILDNGILQIHVNKKTPSEKGKRVSVK